MSARQSLDPKNDLVFKMFFGHPDNQEHLIRLLSAILKPPRPIRAVRIQAEAEPAKNAVDGKEIALDLLVELEGGELINVEMQTEPRPARRARALYYWARVHAGQLLRTQGYVTLRRSVVIWILNFRELEGERFHSVFRVREIHDNEELSEQLEIHFLELPKLDKALKSDEPKLLLWGKFLVASTDSELEQLAMQDSDLQKAKAALDRLSQDPEARALAEMRDRARISYQLDLGKAHEEGIEQGIEKGIERGIEQGITKGEASLLKTLLETRFGELPAAVTERLERATEAQLTEWAKRVLSASSLDAVFADS